MALFTKKEKKHEQFDFLKSRGQVSLKTMRPYVQSALCTWQNETKKSKEEIEYNIDFFGTYLSIIDKLINNLTAKK